MQPAPTFSHFPLFKTLVEHQAKEEKWKKRGRFGPIYVRAGWKVSSFMLELMPNVFDNLHSCYLLCDICHSENYIVRTLKKGIEKPHTHPTDSSRGSPPSITSTSGLAPIVSRFGNRLPGFFLFVREDFIC
jgi:hypothetical protein